MTLFPSFRLLIAVPVLAFALMDGALSQIVLNVPTPSYPTIQDAILAAQSGDTVQVAPGTYYEAIDYLGRVITVVGAGPDVTAIDVSGMRKRAVTMALGEGTGTVLEGFTITGGEVRHELPGPAVLGAGGGLLYISGVGVGYSVGSIAPSTTPMSGPLIKNCRFTHNNAFAGGAVASFGNGSDLWFEDCEFRGNHADSKGGAFFIAKPTRFTRLERCVLEGNSALEGGGLYVECDLIEMVDCTVSSNAASKGGGIYAALKAAEFERVAFLDNVATYWAGAGYFVTKPGLQGIKTFTCCLFAGNQAPFYYGFYLKGPATVRNCTVSGNISTPNGAMAGNHFGTNSAVALLSWSNGVVEVSNSIFNGNSPLDLAAQTGAASLTNCNLSGFYAGAGNIAGPPGFVNPAIGDYRLDGGSSLIDAGWNPAAVGISWDLDRNPRLLDGQVDIGCYERVDVAFTAAATGSIIDPTSSQPVDTLTIAGDAGGGDRRVTIPIGATWTVNLESPDWITPEPDHAIFGMIRHADVPDAVLLPSGIQMSFPPCWSVQDAAAGLFVLSSTVSGLPWPELVSVPKGDVVVGPLPGIPVAFDLSLQALFLDAVANPYISNLVLIEVR